MPSRLSARISSITPSATLAVDAKAKALKAAGEPVIGFGAGEPDFPTPAHIVEAAVEAARDPKNHKYSPAVGLPELREAIAAATSEHSGVDVEAGQVLVTNGGKQAVYNVFQALLDPGDEVLLPAPYWTTYPEAIKLADGISRVVPSDETTGYKVTVDQLDAACTDRTKALLFCSPSNPSGAVYSQAQTIEIGRWAAEKGLWVITDEIYEHLVYGANEFTSIVGQVPALEDRWVILNGVAKTYAMTGWRVGWMVGPTDVIKAAGGLQSHSTSNVANVSQRAALAAITGGLDDVMMMREAFDNRRRIIHKQLNEIPGVECVEPEGAFYAYPSFKGVLDTVVAGRTPANTVELADIILETAKVAVVPGEAFGTPGFMRFSYAMDEDDMVEGVSRIANLIGGA